MTEYTPTTDRVRADYAETYEGTDERRYARFDRWLNEIRAEAWDKGHGYPCDKWIRAEMCREYHPNPYLPIEK